MLKGSTSVPFIITINRAIKEYAVDATGSSGSATAMVNYVMFKETITNPDI